MNSIDEFSGACEGGQTIVCPGPCLMRSQSSDSDFTILLHLVRREYCLFFTQEECKGMERRLCRPVQKWSYGVEVGRRQDTTAINDICGLFNVSCLDV